MSDCKMLPFTTIIEAWQCPFPNNIACDDKRQMTYLQWSFLFSCSFLPHPLKSASWSSFLFFLFLIFVDDPFIKVLFVFNLVLKLQFLIYFFFQFGPYSFLSLVFVFGPLIKVLLIFNFIIQSKFCWLGHYSLDLFSLVKVIFLFNLTLQSKKISCSLIYFLFRFSPLLF
jgi:hypothetical protein